MMQTSKTALAVLKTMLVNANGLANAWVMSLNLSTFPKTGTYADNPEIRDHSACDRWRWEDWDEFTNDYEHMLELVRDTTCCEEVEDARQLLLVKLEYLIRFRSAIGDSIDEICR